jgi:Periplasmic binding protein
VFNFESFAVEVPDWRPRHDEYYHEACASVWELHAGLQSFRSMRRIVPWTNRLFRWPLSGREFTPPVPCAPGIDVETAFKRQFEGAGGKVVESLRVSLSSNDFAPALQRVADAKPDAIMGFVSAGVGPIFIRQFVERGLDKSGIKFIAEGSLTEDDIVNQIGDAALGVITSQHYSAAHNSPENKSFVEAFKEANGGMRPNLMAMQSYDGMFDLRSLEEDQRIDRWRRNCRRDEGHELGQPARTCHDRSSDARSDPKHLYPKS